MNDKRILIALGAGLFAGLLAFWLMAEKIKVYERQSTPTDVLVATTFIPAESPLRPNQIEKRKIPAEFIDPSAIQDPKEVEGLITLVPISAGEQILSNKFGLPGNGLALTLPQGLRAFTLEVNEMTGVGGLLNPGDRVDILSHLETNQKQITATVLQNVLVLATGIKTSNFSSDHPSSNAAPANPGENSQNSYDTVTVAVTPEQAEMLAFLDERHPLRFVLRSPGDEEILPLAPQSDLEMINKIGTFSKPREKSLEVIRGIQNTEEGQ